MHRNIIWALLLTLLVALPTARAAAADAATQCPVLIAPTVYQAPVIDGRIDEAAWLRADETRRFVLPSGKPAKRLTTARILRCADTLYIACRCELAPGQQPRAEYAQRDSDLYMDECIELFIDPNITLRAYYHFIVSAANVQRDEKGDTLGSPSYDVRWDAQWASATSVSDASWTVEMAIPLSVLGIEPGEPALLGLNLCRNDTTAPEGSCWAPTFGGYHSPDRFGVVSLPAAIGRQRIEMELGPVAEFSPGDNEQTIAVTNMSRKEQPLTGRAIVAAARGRAERPFAIGALAPGARVTPTIDVRIEHYGAGVIVLAAADEAGNVWAARKLRTSLNEMMYREYGYQLGGDDRLGLWWAEATNKVHREHPRPVTVQETVRLSAAANEFEAVQIVVKPSRTIDVTAEVTDFTGPGGTLPAQSFSLRRVEYVPVEIPTDVFGFIGDWPDPIVPLEGATHCEMGRNQPFWLLAHVPPGTPAGVYSGAVSFSDGELTQRVPVRLQLYDFELTPETHIRSAYGVSPPYGFLGVQTAEDKREVHDLYMQTCRDHRIAPYSPYAQHPLRIETHPPITRLSTGAMTVELPHAGENTWRLLYDGAQIATQKTSMTHFEKEGIGYQGTGVGWPYVNTIKSVTPVSISDSMRVYDVVAAHAGSAEAARAFELTFRFYIPAGDNWIALRLVKMVSTDPVDVEVRNYFNIPNTACAAKTIANGTGYAAWADEEFGFGMLCLDGAASGLSIKEGGQAVTVANGVEPFRIKQGDSHDGWGPLAVYFLSEDISAEGLAGRAEWLRAHIDPKRPEAYVPETAVALVESSRDDYTFTYDFTEFDKGMERYIDEFHFNAFNYPAMPQRIGNAERFTEDYKRLHKQMYGPVIEHLREKGWLEYAYAYWYDEPGEEDYPYVIEGMKLLAENCPGLTRLLTEQPEQPLYGSVDLWVPVLGNFRPADCAARQEAGDDVWWYVCCGPRAPYPNNFIDHPAINHRIRFWMADKYNIQGSLYWSTTYHGLSADRETGRNPWTEAMSYSGTGGTWGNGDGFLLYPACRVPSSRPVTAPPVDSLRFEMLRDGIEDFEYLWTLKQEVSRLEKLRGAADGTTRAAIDAALKQAGTALGAPDRLAQSPAVYTQDVLTLMAERQRVAEAIEACRAVGR